MIGTDVAVKAVFDERFHNAVHIDAAALRAVSALLKRAVIFYMNVAEVRKMYSALSGILCGEPDHIILF